MQQRLGASAGVGAHQHLATLPVGQLGQRGRQGGDVIGAVVRRRSPRTQVQRQDLPGALLAVVDERTHRREPIATLVGRRRVFLVRMRGDQRGIEIHDHLPTVPSPGPASQRPSPRPHRGPGPSMRRADRRHHRIDIIAQRGDQPRHRRIPRRPTRTAPAARGPPPDRLDSHHPATAVATSTSTLPGSCLARGPRHGASATDNAHSTPDNRRVCPSNSPPADDTSASRAGSRTTLASRAPKVSTAARTTARSSSSSTTATAITRRPSRCASRATVPQWTGSS